MFSLSRYKLPDVTENEANKLQFIWGETNDLLHVSALFGYYMELKVIIKGTLKS
jgi:hypothetical protein